MDLDCKELERLKELVPYKILAPTPNEIINYIEQLQSNWNSLREWLISYRTNIENPDFYEEGIIDCIDEILDKMNELEGATDE